MKKIRTRFAPSPTGKMHVGNLRSALYEYLVAKHEDGDFVIRIEDTDQERFVEGAVEIIFRTLEKAGIFYDEGPEREKGYGPYVQSERQKQGIYRKYAEELIAKGEAYYCFCDKERLAGLKTEVVEGKEISVYDRHCFKLSPAERAEKLKAGVPHVIRQNNPQTGTTVFHDELYGDIEVENAELDDMILIKSDGFPTYNFANVVDDHLMEITHVVRGNEYLSSSPKYNRLYQAFGWEVPTYIHLPLITDENHKKLSKRSGHSSFEDLLEQGFLPEAVVNFIALLGWSPESNREIFSLAELIAEFDYRRISKSPAVFDMGKLKWMNGEYLKAMEFSAFYEQALPVIREAVGQEKSGPEGNREEAFPAVREMVDWEETGQEADREQALPVTGEMTVREETGQETNRQQMQPAVSEMGYRKIAEMVKTRIELWSDIPELIDFLGILPDYDTEMYVHKKMKTTKESALEVLKEVLPLLEEQTDYSNDGLYALLLSLAEQKGCKNGYIMWPVRTAVSGKQTTPAGATEIMELLGKDESLRRIKVGIELLSQ